MSLQVRDRYLCASYFPAVAVFASDDDFKIWRNLRTNNESRNYLPFYREH